MKAAQDTCPNCGARLQVGAVETLVQCEYCGTASRVQRRTRFLERALPPPASGPRPIAVQKHNPAVLIVVLGGVIGTLAVGALVASLGVRSPPRVGRGLASGAGRGGGQAQLGGQRSARRRHRRGWHAGPHRSRASRPPGRSDHARRGRRRDGDPVDVVARRCRIRAGDQRWQLPPGGGDRDWRDAVEVPLTALPPAGTRRGEERCV